MSNEVINVTMSSQWETIKIRFSILDNELSKSAWFEAHERLTDVKDGLTAEEMLGILKLKLDSMPVRETVRH